MKNTIRKFYYSRKKLGLYLLFNILLLSLAVLFTLTIFPDYPAVYYFALSSCFLSVIGALIVFIVPLPLAIITAESIKIDRGAPLLWKQIDSVQKIRLSKHIFSKSILRINTSELTNYRYTFMQKITAKSDFGAFSIPLYAMNSSDARSIERIIRSHLKPTKQITKRKLRKK